MATTLLQNVQNVANEAGYQVGSTVVGNNDVTTKQLLAIATRVVKEMAEQYPWPVLFASYSFTLVNGQSLYPVPGSFSYYHYETFWNQSNRWRILGPMTPQEYAEIIGYGLNTTVYSRFQFRGLANNQILINPTPTAATAGQTVIFEYVADRPVRPKTWTTSTVFAAGSYCFYNGNYYTTTAGGTTGATAPTHTSGSVSDGGVTWAFYDGAYSDFLADTDICNLNPKTLEQGMLERFAEIHGLTTVGRRYDIQLNEDFSRQNPGKLLYAGGHTRSTIFARNGTAVFGSWI